MKHIQFIRAYNVLQKISNFDLPVRDAYAIFKLFKEVEPTYEFAVKMERQLVEKYHGEITESGAIKFVHGDDEQSRMDGTKNMNMFAAEIEELNETEIDESFTPVTLKYDAFGDQKISPKELMAIDGFIIFE